MMSTDSTDFAKLKMTKRLDVSNMAKCRVLFDDNKYMKRNQKYLERATLQDKTDGSYIFQALCFAVQVSSESRVGSNESDEDIPSPVNSPVLLKVCALTSATPEGQQGQIIEKPDCHDLGVQNVPYKPPECGYITTDDVGYFLLHKAPNSDYDVLRSLHYYGYYIAYQNNRVVPARTNSSDPATHLKLQFVDYDVVDGVQSMLTAKYFKVYVYSAFSQTSLSLDEMGEQQLLSKSSTSSISAYREAAAAPAVRSHRAARRLASA